MMSTLQHGNRHADALSERDAVLAELKKILSSPHFCNSKRYPALLQYVVEEALAGRADLLKERTIGVDVFERPATHDTNTDTIVRFTAGEVRKRLAAYYHDAGHVAGLRISLPHGSYIPDFLADVAPDSAPQHDHHPDISPRWLDGEPVQPETPREVHGQQAATSSPERYTREDENALASHVWLIPKIRRMLFVGSAIVVALVALAAWRLGAGHTDSPLEAFWRPLIHDRGTILLCAGGNVFAPHPTPEFIAADKETEYPYFSLQTATSITQLSSFIQQKGASAEFEFAATTPLPDLHSHAIILLNAYNNQWTMRLLDPLRFHFSPKPHGVGDEGIVDRTVGGVRWKRDLSLPYSNTDDYAVVARFWDTTTDNWVLVLAGLGRNGTEAASEFVTGPHYLQTLRDRLGSDFANRNMEVVLKVNVIDGKTGPPSMMATYTW